MLKIRLQRVGRKHEPTFRLVLTDSKNSTKSGKYLENLGNYDSRRGEQASFKEDKIKYWMSKGAQVSATVHNLLVSRNVISGKKINVLPSKKPTPTQQVGEPTENIGFAKEVKEEVSAKTETTEEVVETPAEVVVETPSESPVQPEETKEEVAQ